jgi:hypothetical protein
MKKMKFQRNQKIEPLDPATEILGLSTLLELVLEDERYETAALIQSRLEQIKLDQIAGNNHP